MAKTPKLKKRDISIHSRAVRRGSEPAPKDLTSLQSPITTESDYKPWLHSAQNAGIQKKQKKKTLTRAQKLRQQKGAERADENAARLAKKVADSKRRARAVQARRQDWEDLNDNVKAVREVEKGRFGVLEEEGEEDWESEVEETVGDWDGDKDMGATAAAGEVLTVRSGAEMEEEPVPAPGSPPQVLNAVSAVVESNPAWASMHANPGDFLGGEVT